MDVKYDTTVQQNSCAHNEIFKRNSNNWELMYAVFRTDTNSSRRGRRMLRRNTFQTRGITESTDPDSVTLPSFLFFLICCEGITRMFTSKQMSAECPTHPQVSSSPDETTPLILCIVFGSTVKFRPNRKQTTPFLSS